MWQAYARRVSERERLHGGARITSRPWGQRFRVLPRRENELDLTRLTDRIETPEFLGTIIGRAQLDAGYRGELRQRVVERLRALPSVTPGAENAREMLGEERFKVALSLDLLWSSPQWSYWDSLTHSIDGVRFTWGLNFVSGYGSRDWKELVAVKVLTFQVGLPEKALVFEPGQQIVEPPVWSPSLRSWNFWAADLVRQRGGLTDLWRCGLLEERDV